MRSKYQQLPIWCDATRLLREVEKAERRFPRYQREASRKRDKYALGSDLRRQAVECCRPIVRAAEGAALSPEIGARQLVRLSLALEDIKLSIQLAKEIEAFASFSGFARIARIARILRAGAWYGDPCGLSTGEYGG